MRFLLCSLLLLSGPINYCQILTVSPPKPMLMDEVTVIYDAKLGNGELAGYNGPVYAHAGLLTSESIAPSDWKYVATSWTQNDPAYQMQPLGDDLYQLTFEFQEFYGFPQGEEIVALAFVFRSATGDLVGRDANDADIFYFLPEEAPSQFVDYELADSSVYLMTDAGSFRLRAFASQTIQVAYLDSLTEVLEPGLAVIQPPFADVINDPAEIIDSTDYLQFQMADLEVLVQKNPFQIQFIRPNSGDTLLQQSIPGYVVFASGHKRYAFKIDPEEAFMGAGSRATEMDLRGRQLEVYNHQHYGYGDGADLLNIASPFLLSSKRYGLFFDSPWKGRWDIGASQPDELRYEAWGGQLSYYLIGGDDLTDLFAHYTKLTGEATMPPRWALGYIQSKFGYQNQQEAISVVEDLLANDFPLDALILDLYWFGDPSTMGNLDWDLNRFPDPVGMMDDFADQGIQTIVITEPYFTLNSDHYDFLDTAGYLGFNADGDSYVLDNFWAGPAGLLDMTNPEALEWIWPFYQELIDEGVGGFWSDLGEPELHPGDLLFEEGGANEHHNSYSFRWAKMLHENIRAAYPNRRQFNLIRSGFNGQHRFGTYPWSGDVARNFSGLRAQVPIMLHASMSGFPYMSSDLGGFVGNNQHQDELFIRWMQLGVFSPIMRVHGTGLDTEPTAYGPATQAIVRELIQHRYDLLPYNLDLAGENVRFGTPMARPLHYYDPENASLQDVRDTYYWGEHILVAPILAEGQESRMVQFPDGHWTDVVSGVRYPPYSQAMVDMPQDQLHYFVRSGSFLPMVVNLKNTSQYDLDTVHLFHTPAITEELAVYEQTHDDGLGLQPDWGEYIRYTADFVAPDSTAYSITVEKFGSSPAMLIGTDYYLKMPKLGYENLQISQDQTTLLAFNALADFENGGAGWYEGEDYYYIHFEMLENQLETEVLLSGDLLGVEVTSKSSLWVQAPVPNPTSGSVSVSLKLQQAENLRYDLFNPQGQLLQTVDLGSLAMGNHTFQADLTNYPPGLFLLKLQSDHEQHIFKLIKQ